MKTIEQFVQIQSYVLPLTAVQEKALKIRYPLKSKLLLYDLFLMMIVTFVFTRNEEDANSKQGDEENEDENPSEAARSSSVTSKENNEIECPSSSGN